VSGDGRRWRGCVPGVNRATVRIVGGGAGDVTGGDDAAVAAPAITLTAGTMGFVGKYATAHVNIAFTPPASPLYDHMEFLVDDGVAATATTILGTTSPVRFTAVHGVTYTVTPVAVTINGIRSTGTPQSIAVPDNSTITDFRRFALAMTAGVGAMQSAITISFSITTATSATVTVSAFTLKVPTGNGTFTTVSYFPSGGTRIITGSGTTPGVGPRDNDLYLYIDDPGYAGGTPTINWTADPSVVAESATRQLLGSVYIPSGATGTGTGVPGSTKKVN
jgi:hypothetical protein